ncbi:MAG: FkbM family methyltransferase [Phycisphaerales bacterium]|nr:FkbM family methyltransferase [Phycisphaerales bacterium]
MRLFGYDAYASMTRCIDRDAPLVMVDVGANEGLTAQRMLDEFPNATIHAFEPSPGPFAKLLARAEADPRIRPYRLACGSACGTTEFHVTQNDWCSSILPPSELGKRYYGDWYETRETVQVEVTTLDAWAKAHGIDTVDFLKVDAQGYDLEVLKGATELLHAALKGLNCECQFAPEYEGCATFSQVDRFLAEHGFALHQIHEVWAKGKEEQSSYADALWLRVDVLQALRARSDIPDLSPRGRVTRALEQAAAKGHQRAAIFGAGQHSRRIADHFAEFPLPVLAIVDDNPRAQGTQLGNRPIVSQQQAIAMGVDVVVLSSDAHEAALWQSAQPLRDAGVTVLPLYSRPESSNPRRAATAAAR